MSESTAQSAAAPAAKAAPKAAPKAAAKVAAPNRKLQLAIGVLALFGLFTIAKGPISNAKDSIEDAYRPQVQMVTVNPATPGAAK